MTKPAFFGEPRILRLATLLEEISAGEIRVPRFQRPFVWTDEQRLTLMDSIYNGYPIGAILVWRTHEHRLRTYDHLGPLRLPPESQEETTRQYLLDGHQRLTTLFGALGPGLRSRDDEGQGAAWLPEDREEKRRWPIYFDLEVDRSELRDAFRLGRRREPPPSTWLPLEILLDPYSLLDFQQQLLMAGYAREMLNRVQSLAAIFRDYTVPVIPLVSESLEQVTSCFRRISTGGTPMSELNMINALSALRRSSGPDFLERVDELIEGLPPVGWASFGPQMVLNVCKLRVGTGRSDAQDLEWLAQKLGDDSGLLGAVRDGILTAVHVLDEIAGVRGPRSLPYGYHAVLLADVMGGAVKPTRAVLDRLRQWFWITTLGEYFAGMSSSPLWRAREHLREVVHGTADPCPRDMSRLVEPIERFDYRSPRSRGMALLMAEHGPVGLEWRRDDPFDALAEYGSDALLRLVSERDVEARDNDLVRGIGNRFLLHPKDGEYLSILSLVQPEALARNFIDAGAKEALDHKDWHTFLTRRRAALERVEQARVEECGLTYRPRG